LLSRHKTQRDDGKRDFLSNDAKDLIREAGIFHIITISGVQMTLVAGIFFIVSRRLLALSPTLALKFPIKKWICRGSAASPPMPLTV
jgi:predicted membrane metal-binding protein